MKKPFAILFLFILLSSLLAGCSGQTTEEALSPSKAEIQGSITVRCFGGDSSTVIADYNYFSSATNQLTILETPIMEETGSSSEQQYLELLTQQTADIYIFSTDYMGIFYSLLNSSFFLDLNPLIEQSDIQLEEYQSMVMDTGLQGEKRVFLPISYKIDMFTLTTQQLAEYGISKDEISLSYDNWEESEKLLLKAFPGKSASLFSNDSTIFRRMISSKYLDEMDKRANFLSQDFVREIDSYLAYTETHPESEQDLSLGNPYEIMDKEIQENLQQQMDAQKTILFGQSFDGNALAAARLTRTARYDNGKEARFFAIKDTGKDTYRSYANCLFTINKKCKNPQEALAVAEFLLSEEYQRGDFFANLNCNLGGLPVHIRAQEQMLENAKKTILLREDQMAGLVEDYEEIVENTTSCGLLMDTRFIEKIFNPMLEDYRQGFISEQDFYNRMDTKSSLFLMER